MPQCKHDYANPVRKGRADLHCRLCDADITLQLVMMAEADREEAGLRQCERLKRLAGTGKQKVL